MSASAGTASEAGGTSGPRAVTDGAAWRVALKVCAAMILLILVFDTENVFSVVREHARSGQPIPVWEPVLWEGSSALAYLVFGPLVYLMARLAPPRPGGWLRFVLVHPPATALFSALHILGMVAVRIAVYAALGQRYGGRLFDFVYEYPKDIPGYVLIVGLTWLFSELEARRTQPAASSAAATLDIKDGSKVIRAPMGDILALSSAGNYVEVMLADGRRPLMRTTLAKAEAQLGPHGFVRTHRSWLVNAARVRELTAAGSGDFVVTLDGGVQAPLSRRFPAALQSLWSATP